MPAEPARSFRFWCDRAPSTPSLRLPCARSPTVRVATRRIDLLVSRARRSFVPARTNSVVDLLPDRLLIVLLPVGPWQRDGPAGPCPGRLSWGGPYPGADGHSGGEFHGRAQRGRGHPPVRRRLAGSH